MSSSPTTWPITCTSQHAQNKQQYRRQIEKLFSDGRHSAATNATELKILRRLLFLRRPLKLTVSILQETGVIPDVTEEEMASGSIDLDGTMVDEALRSLPNGSANWALGWTCGVIRRLYTNRLADDTGALIDLLDAPASGSIPNKHWVTSRAVIIPKANGNGHRPLGIGEAWYRFLGRAILLKLGKEVGGGLKPLQLGCDVPGGCEIASRMAQVFLEVNPIHVLIKTDFKNAFNLTPRSAIFRGIETFCPKLLPWYRWAYGAPSPLVNSVSEHSERGCR